MFKDPVVRYRSVSLLLGSMVMMMGGFAIAPGIAGMGEHFSDVQNSALLVKLVVTIPFFVIAVSSFFIGGLLDRFGRKSTLLIASFGCGVAAIGAFSFRFLIYKLGGVLTLVWAVVNTAIGFMIVGHPDLI